LFIKHLETGLNNRPKNLCGFIVVPDVVADRKRTIDLWFEWESRLRSYNCPLAFAVQNEMTCQDVPPNVDVIFVGGTFNWKWRTAAYWCKNFPHVHIARVNSWQRLWYCKEIGAKSIDGTGWVKGADKRIDLELFLAITSSKYKIPSSFQVAKLSRKTRIDLLDAFLTKKNIFDLNSLPLFTASKMGLIC
ncbi:MAG: hypothetical protein ACRC8K_23650, partial [Waterburya sp.]